MTINTRVVARFGRLAIDVDRARAAHHIAEEALVHHDERVDAWYAENLKRDPKDTEFLAYLHREQKEDAANGYPQTLRSALFVTGYGVLERFMTSLCKEIEAEVPGPRLSDLRGEGIQRARLFLERVANVPFPDTGEWHRLLLYGKLRNAVVHAQGDLAGAPYLQAIRQLRAQEQTFDLVDGDSAVVLLKQFNPRFLALIDEFAEQLDRAVDRYIHAT